MDRICTDSFTNKKKMVISFIQKSVLVLAIFVMMAGAGHAGPTYTYNSFLTHPLSGSVSETDVTSPNTHNTKNKSTSTDTWNGSYGYTDSDAYTGVYIGTFDEGDKSLWKGNPPYLYLKDLIEAFLNPDPSFEGYGKRDYEDPFDLDTEDDVTDLNITYDDVNAYPYTGTWEVSTSDGSNTSFYGVKKSTEFALYYIDEQGASSGKYTTAHVHPENPAEPLSNLFVVKIHLDPPDTPPGDPPVPEPATMLLFGFSLIGLAGVARRRNGRF